jgi:hypothetical protein
MVSSIQEIRSRLEWRLPDALSSYFSSLSMTYSIPFVLVTGFISTFMGAGNQSANRIALKTGLEKENRVTKFGEMPDFGQWKAGPYRMVYLIILSCLILVFSVVRGIPSLAAAPFDPATFPLLSAKAASMISFS